jgi:hypothetical protein
LAASSRGLSNAEGSHPEKENLIEKPVGGTAPDKAAEQTGLMARF